MISHMGLRATPQKGLSVRAWPDTSASLKVISTPGSGVAGGVYAGHWHGPAAAGPQAAAGQKAGAYA